MVASGGAASTGTKPKAPSAPVSNAKSTTTNPKKSSSSPRRSSPKRSSTSPRARSSSPGKVGPGPSIAVPTTKAQQLREAKREAERAAGGGGEGDGEDREVSLWLLLRGGQTNNNLRLKTPPPYLSSPGSEKVRRSPGRSWVLGPGILDLSKKSTGSAMPAATSTTSSPASPGTSRR